MCRTWAPKGQTPIIRSTASRKRRSVIGVIRCTLKARNLKLYLRIFKKSIGSLEITRTLKELHRHVKGRKVFLLWDNLPVHKSDEVFEFIDSQKSWLEVYRFPAYAPDLNPPEYLWSSGKKKDLAGLYLDKINEADNYIHKYGRRVRRTPNLLKGFIKKSTLFEQELSR